MSDTAQLQQLPYAELEVLGERVFCDDELRFAWGEVAALPDEAALARMNARNETVLRTLALVEEHDETQSEDAERAELHRLEAKLNLALELLAELVATRQDGVPTHTVRFNSRGVCWNAPAAPPVASLLLVELYTLPAWPVPLKMHARVKSTMPRDGGERVCAQLDGLTPGVRNWLEKLVFRRHRRAIALSRGAR